MQAPTLITFLFLSLVAISLAAGSKDPIPPSDLLLARDNFPTEGITEIARDPAATYNNETAVQVELKAPGFTILESLVLFETREVALSILADINEDHGALGIVSSSAAGFDHSSGIIVEHLDGEQASTVFLLKDVPSGRSL